MNQSSSSRDSDKTPPHLCSRCSKPLAKDLKFTISSWFMTDPTEGLNRWQECCKCDFRSDLDELEALTASVGAALGDDYWPDDQSSGETPLAGEWESGIEAIAISDASVESQTATTAMRVTVKNTIPDVPSTQTSGDGEALDSGGKRGTREPQQMSEQLSANSGSQFKATVALGSRDREQARTPGGSKEKASKSSSRTRSQSNAKPKSSRGARKNSRTGMAGTKDSVAENNLAGTNQSKDDVDSPDIESPDSPDIDSPGNAEPNAQVVAATKKPSISGETELLVLEDRGTIGGGLNDRHAASEIGGTVAAKHSRPASGLDSAGNMVEAANGKHQHGTAGELCLDDQNRSIARGAFREETLGTASSDYDPDKEYVITVVPPAEPARPQAYVIADRYSVQSVIGKGTLGTTYRVIDAGTGRLLCLKLVSSPICRHRRVVKRIMQEVEKAQTLNHPHIVPIYDSGMDKTSRLYYVMDYLEQGSLKKLIRDEGFLDVPETLQIFLDVCDGLKYSHQQGILHRDLKPGNILLVGEGKHVTAKLSDFGIAKAIPSAGSEALAMTQSTDVFADPSFMSPEQCLGKKIDIRSEIYSLGCAMYEALVGKRVFRGPNALSIVVQHFKAQPKSFEEVMYNCDISSDVEAVVFRMLEKAPENRYQSIEQLEEDLLLLKHNKRPSYAYSKKKNLRSPALIPAELDAIETPPRLIGLVQDDDGRQKKQRNDGRHAGNDGRHAGNDGRHAGNDGRHAGNEWRSPPEQKCEQKSEQKVGESDNGDSAEKKARDYKARQEMLRERERKVREEIRYDRERRGLEDLRRERGGADEEAGFGAVDVNAVSRDIKRLTFPSLPGSPNPPLFPKIVHQDGPVVLPFAEEPPGGNPWRSFRVRNDHVILPGRIKLTEVKTSDVPEDIQTSFGQIVRSTKTNWGQKQQVFDLVSMPARNDPQSATQLSPLVADGFEMDEDSMLKVTTAEEARRVVPDYLLPTEAWPLTSVVVVGSLIATLSILIFLLNFAGYLVPSLAVSINLVILVCAVIAIVQSQSSRG